MTEVETPSSSAPSGKQSTEETTQPPTQRPVIVTVESTDITTSDKMDTTEKNKHEATARSTSVARKSKLEGIRDSDESVVIEPVVPGNRQLPNFIGLQSDDESSRSDSSPELQESGRRRYSNEHLEDHQTTRRKKVKMFEGVTDAERRQLRKDQRNLHATSLVDGTTLDQVRHKNNILFKNVRWTRELVLDADNVDVLVSQHARQVEQKVQVRVVESFEVSIGLISTFLTFSVFHLLTTGHPLRCTPPR
jgi:hypothetical protein